MAMGHDTVVKLPEESIKYLEYFDMVDKYFIKQLTDNIKLLGGHINVYGAMVATPFFKFGAKLQMRLESTSNLM